MPRRAFAMLSAAAALLCLAYGALSLDEARDPAVVAGLLVLFAAAVLVSLLWPGEAELPAGVASAVVAVAIVLCVVLADQYDLRFFDRGGMWHTTAVALLMVILCSRLRYSFAWAGMAMAVVVTVALEGPTSLLSHGLIGGLTWVAVCHMLMVSLTGAARDARQYVLAEREAAEWRAVREARVFERQFRLSLTGRTALPILNEIVEKGALLDEDARRECLTVEDSIRDEIRGRRLLDDGVRREVLSARRRGASVALLDEGGLDDMPRLELERVHGALTTALAGTAADRITVRTAPASSDTAVTVVGVTGGGPSAPGGPSAMGDEEDELALWLEIPRRGATPAW